MNLESLNWRFRTQYTIQAKTETTNHVEQLTNWWQDHNTTNIVSDLVFVFVFWFYFIFSDWNSRWRKWKLCDLNGNELIHSRVGINNTHTHTLINNLNVCVCCLYTKLRWKEKERKIQSIHSILVCVLCYFIPIWLLLLFCVRNACQKCLNRQTAIGIRWFLFVILFWLVPSYIPKVEYPYVNLVEKNIEKSVLADK